MIDFFFGKPRTGKSYRAVDLIHKEYIKDGAKPKYKNILTNIGGFVFDEINEHFKIADSENPSTAYRLVWKDFYIHLEKMYSMALDDKSDDELNTYADYHNINDCLIVIDEAALYMKKYDDVISWWLAYHGHFKIRIVIIAQGPRQINADYLVHTEIYYVAQPQSKQLKSNKLRYIHYSEIPFSRDSKFGSNTLTASTDIYDLYKSGEVDKPKKIIYKFIFLSLLAIFAMVGLYKFLQYRLSPEPEISVSNSTHTIDELNLPTPGQNNLIKPNSTMSKDTFLLSLKCNEQYCWNADTNYEATQISLNYFKTLVIKFKIELFYSEVKTEVYTLKPFEKTLSKNTLAKLTDYIYIVPKDFKTTFLSSLFKSKYKEVKSSSILANNSSFMQSGDLTKNDERLSEE
ncbi:MAG: zona occludens toxin [Sulfurimonas sp.]|jgi:zona occludens toxin